MVITKEKYEAEIERLARKFVVRGSDGKIDVPATFDRVQNLVVPLDEKMQDESNVHPWCTLGAGVATYTQILSHAGDIKTRKRLVFGAGVTPGEIAVAWVQLRTMENVLHFFASIAFAADVREKIAENEGLRVCPTCEDHLTESAEQRPTFPQAPAQA